MSSGSFRRIDSHSEDTCISVPPGLPTVGGSAVRGRDQPRNGSNAQVGLMGAKRRNALESSTGLAALTPRAGHHATIRGF